MTTGLALRQMAGRGGALSQGLGTGSAAGLPKSFICFLVQESSDSHPLSKYEMIPKYDQEAEPSSAYVASKCLRIYKFSAIIALFLCFCVGWCDIVIS